MIEDIVIDLDVYSLGIQEGIQRVIDSFVYMEIIIIVIIVMDVRIDLGVCVKVSFKYIINQ